MATTPDRSEDADSTADGSVQSSAADEGTAQPGVLQLYYEDDKCVPPSKRIQCLLTLAVAYLPGFTMDDYDKEPFSHKLFSKCRRDNKPKVGGFKAEIKRRNPNVGRFTNTKLCDLVKYLQQDDYKLDAVDQVFLQKTFDVYKKSLVDRIEENAINKNKPAEEGAVSKITTMDRLRLIEAMLSDAALPLMRSSQEVLNRAALDARNSVHKVQDYFDKVAEVFNSEDFIATTDIVDNLCEELKQSYTIERGTYTMDATKAKEIYYQMKNKLHQIIGNWELSGNGEGQRSDDDPNWGSCDAYDLQTTGTVNGADRVSFLRDPKEWYLLYFWHRLDQLKLVHFTLAKLPKWMSANASSFVIVASSDRHDMKMEARRELNSTIGNVGIAIKRLVDGQANERIAEFIEKVSDLELKILCEDDEEVKHLLRKRKEQFEQLLEEEKKSKMNN